MSVKWFLPGYMVCSTSNPKFHRALSHKILYMNYNLKFPLFALNYNMEAAKKLILRKIDVHFIKIIPTSVMTFIG